MKDNRFCSLFPLQKTLQLELVPVEVTANKINEQGIIESEFVRYNDSIEVKELIKEYDKELINKTLSNDNIFSIDLLKDFYNLYISNNSDSNKLNAIQKKLREQLAKHFNKEKYPNLLNDKLIKEELLNFVNDEQKRALVEKFKSSTTYFNSLNKNRKNIYSAEDMPASIAHRTVNVNLPKFIDNMKVFQKLLNTSIYNELTGLYNNFSMHINVFSIDEVFELSYYNSVLTQKEIEVYNSIIGGFSCEDGTKIKGLNEYINLYNQQQKDKKCRLPLFKELYNQILSDKSTMSYIPESFESDKDVLTCLDNECQKINSVLLGDEKSLKSLLLNISDYDLSKIYIKNDKNLTDLSNKIFGNYSLLNEYFINSFRSTTKRTKSDNDEKYLAKLVKKFNTHKYFSFAEINDAIESIDSDVKNYENVQDYFSKFSFNDNTGSNILDNFQNAYSEFKEYLKNTYAGQKISQDDITKEYILNLLNSIKVIQHFVNPLLNKELNIEKDDLFYTELLMFDDIFKSFNILFNKIRNYISKKIEDDVRVIPVDFGVKNLGNGFTNGINHTQYGTYAFRKKNAIDEYDYYLGVTSDTNMFNENVISDNDISEFERLDYYKIQTKQIFNKSYSDEKRSLENEIIEIIDKFVDLYASDECIEQINAYKSKSNKKSDIVLTALGYFNFIKSETIYDKIIQSEEFKKANRNVVIFYKSCIRKFNKIQEFSKLADDCSDDVLFDVLYNKIEHISKTVRYFKYIKVSDSDFNDALTRTEKPMYLFKITNKDLSFAETFSKGLRKSRGIDDLHTMFFKFLMEGDSGVFDLCTSEIRFREKCITYSDEKMKTGHHYEMLKDNFNYPIISKKRYTHDKFILKLSITINYKEYKYVNINALTNNYIKETNDLHIIGIDRGERNLIYISIIDLNGNIIDQYSMNTITSKYMKNDKEIKFETNYHSKLKDRENDRQNSRRKCTSMKSIKDLKKGFINQVIHHISQLILDYNAIVVLEDLNSGFKNNRKKIESSVYQEFENSLIKKMNYLCIKTYDKNEIGSVLNGLQLTNIDNKDKLQNGFLFYIAPQYTSSIDPVTGFINMFKNEYVNINESKEFFDNFDDISYNSDNNYFEFKFNYSKFTTKYNKTRMNWTVCSFGKRIDRYKDLNNRNISEEIILTDAYKKLFEKYNICIYKNLKESIVMQSSAQFFKDLRKLFKLTVQLRNSMPGTEIDYIQSPVADENGVFFNSNQCSDKLPENADANGAYNIARKGLMYINQIKNNEKLNVIKNEDWLNFIQK